MAFLSCASLPPFSRQICLVSISPTAHAFSCLDGHGRCGGAVGTGVKVMTRGLVPTLCSLKKEEVKVEVEDHGNVLKISGERSKKEVQETHKWHHVDPERPYGEFLRKFRLPKNVKLDQVAASVENGVLTVTVPKVEEKKPEVRNIDVIRMNEYTMYTRRRIEDK